MKRFSTYTFKVPIKDLPVPAETAAGGQVSMTVLEEYKTSRSSTDIVKITKEAMIDEDYVCATLSPDETKRFVEGTALYQARGLTADGESWFSDRYIEPVEDVLDRSILQSAAE